MAHPGFSILQKDHLAGIPTALLTATLAERRRKAEDKHKAYLAKHFRWKPYLLYGVLFGLMLHGIAQFMYDPNEISPRVVISFLLWLLFCGLAAYGRRLGLTNQFAREFKEEAREIGILEDY